MKTPIRTLLFALTLAVLGLSAARGQPASDGSETDHLILGTDPAETPKSAEDSTQKDIDRSDVVSVGSDSVLEAGKSANSVVAVLGNATSAGEVSDSVVAVIGDVHVTGPVHHAAVAVFGDNYIDSRVDGDAVAVMGDLVLGPHAQIGGQVVAVGGQLRRDPAAIVHGHVNVKAGHWGHAQWLHTWFRECLRYGRPLALSADLTWAWALALGFLAFYILLALAFREGVERCARTLETHPGHTLLAALLSLLLTPVLFVLLFVTVIGIAAVPFVGIAIFCATLFGKAAVLAWLGGRLARPRQDRAPVHPALAVLIGGLLVLALYVIPVVGLIVWKLSGLLALGMVVYTLILVSQERRAPGATGTPGTPGSPPPAEATAAPEAAPQPPPSQTPPPSPPPPLASADSLPRAGFWIRMGALFLDMILIGCVLGFLDRHLGQPMAVMLAIYGALMWKLKGSTVGGIICGLKVVRLDGRPLDWATAVVRALGCFLSLAVVGLGFFWIAFDPGRQAWHDKIAGTAVVRVPKGVSLV